MHFKGNSHVSRSQKEFENGSEGVNYFNRPQHYILKF